MKKNKRVLFIKPPDRFLENEFVYQQLGPHYLQSYLEKHDIESDILILHRPNNGRDLDKIYADGDLPGLEMLHIRQDGVTRDSSFDQSVFGDYDVVGFSVMTPQAPDAYLINRVLKQRYPHIISVIGGSHPRYYQDQVTKLPNDIAFDFVVPQDGWTPILNIASGAIERQEHPTVLSDSLPKLTDLPPPSRPPALMSRYEFEIAGIPAYHTITALGCPFTCHFCESGIERVRMFSETMIEADLLEISNVHTLMKHEKKAIMFFDDVGLMSPKQVKRLSNVVRKIGFDTWRAFTHAYLVVKHQSQLLDPFVETGGKRIGIGLETGSQNSLDLINKRNGKKQNVEEHYEAVSIANSLGVAVDAFTMIYPWEDETDLAETNRLVEFIAANRVNGKDEKGRQMYNHVDSTIMSPYQGTKFFDMIRIGDLPGVEIDPDADPGNMYYKGVSGGSGWAYLRTRLPRSEYENAQVYRNSFRPGYR